MYNSKVSRKITKVNNPIFPFDIERLVGETEEEYEAFCKGFKSSYDMHKGGCFDCEDEDVCCHSELPFNDFECKEEDDIDSDMCPCYEAGYETGWSDGYATVHDDIYDNILLDVEHISRLRAVKLQALKLLRYVDDSDSDEIIELVDEVEDIIRNYVMKEVNKQLDEKGFHN